MTLVRPMRAEEWPVYRDIRLRALLDAPDAFGSTHGAEVALADEGWAARVAAACAGGAARALFAQVDGVVCGLAWCKVSASDPRVADVYQMWVAPQARERGVGTALLQAIVEYAKGAGAEALRLGVTLAESPAMRLYRSFGFAPAGDVEPLRKGSTLMAQTMRLDLRSR
ncbi:MAG: GNAT family N-acetyltransferase [Lautropia sp.]